MGPSVSQNGHPVLPVPRRAKQQHQPAALTALIDTLRLSKATR